VQCHILSFEGPDPYAQAGGIASRINGLSSGLVDAGIETHLWFVGDPNLPGHEINRGVHLHRWCQWISQYHPVGVYDGEEGKIPDYSASLPPYLLENFLIPAFQKEEKVLILAEEWHTTQAILHLDWLLRGIDRRKSVTVLWNANNTFGFHRIDWRRLRDVAIITTVSRYMKSLLQRFGVEAIVIPNGLTEEAYLPPDPQAVTEVRKRAAARTIVTKVARWDWTKRWESAVRTVAAMKREGWQPLMIARGGKEPYGSEVLRMASALGLHVNERALQSPDERGIIDALDGLDQIDFLSLLTPLDRKSCSLLFRAASATLANSSHEPFGLVGLEAMAAKGIACVGNTGEDYAVPGYNTLVMETDDPHEFMGLFGALKNDRCLERALREAGQRTARHFAWSKIIQSVLLPKIRALSGFEYIYRGTIAGLRRPAISPTIA
jgi:glycosyltransferase involved in cell wall biosynthesis